MSYQTLIRRGEDFVTNSDEVDFGFRVKWKDIIGYPRLSSGEFSKVGVEDLDAVDVGLGFEEAGDLGRWWEVVNDGP
uniref:Uncharacterized protein n=1 Tax=Fagus sylvatica TaxID=28930 RepID=A0A2N9HS05_FAGSY